LAEQSVEIGLLAREKGSRIVAHNYLYPEFHEIADRIGDSLGLARGLALEAPRRVDFCAVYFMGATAKMILGDRTRVFACDAPAVLGCSLVSATDYAWLERWKQRNPEGVLVTYVNSSAYAKSISDYVMTSGNAARVIARAVTDGPGRKVLVLPDKFLGYVMKHQAIALLPENLREAANENVEVYAHAHEGFNASCYVHEQIGDEAPERALDEHPEAELMIHPECGCASSCLYKLEQGILPRGRVYYLSTEQMVEHARRSPTREFVVATELGLVYRLRKELPDKAFYPVSAQASCRFMKAATFPKLLRSLREDRVEIVFCDDCCDPKRPFQDDRTVHIQRSVAARARQAIDRMLAI
jgi:quinolinate synthase